MSWVFWEREGEKGGVERNKGEEDNPSLWESSYCAQYWG